MFSSTKLSPALKLSVLGVTEKVGLEKCLGPTQFIKCCFIRNTYDLFGLSLNKLYQSKEGVCNM